jgi:hypothetical protein
MDLTLDDVISISKLCIDLNGGSPAIDYRLSARDAINDLINKYHSRADKNCFRIFEKIFAIDDLKKWNQERVAETANLKTWNQDRATETAALSESNQDRIDEITKLTNDNKLMSEKVESLNKELEDSKVQEILIKDQLTKVSQEHNSLWHLVCNSGVIDCTKLSGVTVEPEDGTLGDIFNN